VLVVDDHPVVLGGVAMLVERTPWIQIAGCARTGREAIERVQELQPDVVLLDLRLPDMLAPEVVRAIRARTRRAAVVVFTAYPDHAALDAAREAGAAGVIVKDASRDDIVALIGRAANGDPLPWGSGLRSPGLIAGELTRLGLTRREYDVLRRVALGETNAEIAAAVYLSRNTVRAYLQSASHKLGARNRVEAMLRASEVGLL
jgi:two-component system nitrate/nitrite response regulator NarL